MSSQSSTGRISPGEASLRDLSRVERFAMEVLVKKNAVIIRMIATSEMIDTA
jgi:hypothetical protein